MVFANSYVASDGFRRVIAAALSSPAICLALGGAVATALAGDGSVVWSRRISLSDAPLILTDAAACDDGGFALLAGLKFSPDGERFSDFVLIRVDRNGAVAWSRPFHSQGWLSYGRLAKRAHELEEFLCIAWYAQAAAVASGPAGSLLLIKSDGDPRLAATLSLPGLASRMYDVTATDAGYVLAGDSAPRPPWWDADGAMRHDVIPAEGLLLSLDHDLALLGSWSVSGGRDTHGLSLRAGLSTPYGLVVTGAVAGQQVTQLTAAVAMGGGTPTCPVARVAPLDDPRVLPSRIVRSGDDLLVLCRDRPASPASTAVIVRKGGDLAAKGRYGLAFDAGALAYDLATAAGTCFVAGSTPPQGTRSDGWLLATANDLACCRTQSVKEVVDSKTGLSFASIPGRISPAKLEKIPVVVTGTAFGLAATSLCGIGIDLAGDSLLQSPYLSLQAAGSDGSTASRGILLRWFFAGPLAAHLPKGDLARTTAGFNRPSDVVSLYRAVWPRDLATRQVTFASDPAAYVDDAARTLYFQAGTATPRDLFAVSCLDAAAYAAAKQAADPLAHAGAFLIAYGDHPLEIELRNHLSVACDLRFAGNSLRVEVVGASDNRPSAARRVTARRVLGSGDGPVARLYGENTACVRVQTSSAQLLSVGFITYDDVLSRLNGDHAWTPVGEFALSTDTATVFHRLENPGQVDVHGVWPRYTGDAFVNIHNYQDRWTAPQGLAAAVTSYVQLSDNDPQAVAQVAGSQAEDGTISLSYLDMLNVAASDFHVARMLGLGHVDAAVSQGASYLHLCVYRTTGDLGDGTGARPVRHLYMSLPTGQDDSRLPLTPDLDAIDYGLSVPTGTGAPCSLTDANGYTPDGTARYIRLRPGCRALYATETGFYAPPDLFDLSLSNLPVSYGVEYRGQNETAWRKPEIAHDSHYVDTAAPPVAEILTTPFPAVYDGGAFIHKETEPGVHVYAVFGVDLFSRPSPISAPRATDVTAFTRRNSLLPPSDIQSQVIQQESTLVLTTAAEQAMLAALKQAGSDLTLVRVCFNYGMAQDDAYGFADTIQIFHRDTLPGNVAGAILAVTDATDPALARISTQPFTYSSGQVAAPNLPKAMKANFVGGVFVAGGQRLVIADIQWPGTTGANPVFVVRRPTTTGAVATANGNTLTVETAPLALSPGDLCMAVENMAEPANWGAGNPLTATIRIGDATWTHRDECFTRADGTAVTRRLRGVWNTATVYDSTPSNAPASSQRQYDVVFDTYILPPHPQIGDANPVTWYKGTVRLPVTGADPEDRRTLIIRQTLIDGNGRLVLRLIDDNGQAGTPITGGGILVNYYPGYKIYLYADTAHGFDASHLMPATGEGSRSSILALASSDSNTLDGQGQAYRSSPSAPQLIAAAEIVDPLPPQRPHGLAYATPPDGEGRSSYTLTVAFDHAPFAVAFYRADALAILDALYENASLGAIRAAIFPPDVDAWFADRFDDLFAFLDDARPAMAAFPAPDGYALPLPDAAMLNLSPAMTAADKAKIKAAALKAFVPLSEQPLIYDRIRTDPTYVPTNRKQTFRDANGDLLRPSDPAFDLAPMAKRTGPNSVQFTDFTLDGAMNPNTVYLYFAREIGSRMQMSEPSPVWGPVKLVNLRPPAAPVLRRMTVTPADAVSGANPRVGFEVIAPAPADPIARLRIYRAASGAEALSLRTMQALPEIDLASLTLTSDGTYLVADDFATDSFVPYGDLLHYRLTWVRDVAWRDAANAPQLTSVISLPTRTFLANLVDVINPQPPLPAASVVSVLGNGDKLVRLSWSKTVHNGTYYPARLMPSGTWMRLGSVSSNAATVDFTLPDALPVRDDDGNLIYYRFRIEVQNSSGLTNIYEAPCITDIASI